MRRSWAVAVAWLAVAVGIALLATAGHGPAVKTDHTTGGPAPMGWSSWSFLRKHPTAASVEAQAQAMVTSGLAARGQPVRRGGPLAALRRAARLERRGLARMPVT